MGKRAETVGKTSSYNPINKDFCDQMKKKHPSLEEYDIQKTVREFNLFLIDAMTRHRDGIALPCYLGYLFVGVFPEKDNKVTWAMKNDPDNAIKFSHYDRDGFKSRIVYSTGRTSQRCAYSKFWGFLPNFEADHIKKVAFDKDWKKYIVIPNIRYIKDVMSTNRAYKYVQALKEDEMKTYNEFDFN